MENKFVKLDRVYKALRHEEADVVAISDFFWTGFLKKCEKKWGKDFDPYRQFDLDYVAVRPNVDPHVKDFQIIEDDGNDIVVKTGFEATIRRRADLAMPHYESFGVNSPEKMEDFTFDKVDEARFYRRGDDQFNCVRDDLIRNIPSWDERVSNYCNDFPVFGGVLEPYEYIWRIIGTENSLIWMLTDEDKFIAFVDRIGQFMADILKTQIKVGNGRLSGIYITGDVAYVNGMLFSPQLWRKVFKPHVKNLIEISHDANLPVIYHGCGNATPIYNDFIEIGLDGYNPLEVKSGLDIVKLKKEYANRLAFVGNFDVRILESGDRNAIKKEALYKLKAAVGGGWICQSDHSVSSDVAPEDYLYLLAIIKEYGKYPLDIEKIESELSKL